MSLLLTYSRRTALLTVLPAGISDVLKRIAPRAILKQKPHPLWYCSDCTSSVSLPPKLTVLFQLYPPEQM